MNITCAYTIHDDLTFYYNYIFRNLRNPRIAQHKVGIHTLACNPRTSWFARNIYYVVTKALLVRSKFLVLSYKYLNRISLYLITCNYCMYKIKLAFNLIDLKHAATSNLLTCVGTLPIEITITISTKFAKYSIIIIL